MVRGINVEYPKSVEMGRRANVHEPVAFMSLMDPMRGCTIQTQQEKLRGRHPSPTSDVSVQRFIWRLLQLVPMRRQ